MPPLSLLSTTTTTRPPRRTFARKPPARVVSALSYLERSKQMMIPTTMTSDKQRQQLSPGGSLLVSNRRRFSAGPGGSRRNEQRTMSTVEDIEYEFNLIMNEQLESPKGKRKGFSTLEKKPQDLAAAPQPSPRRRNKTLLKYLRRQSFGSSSTPPRTSETGASFKATTSSQTRSCVNNNQLSKPHAVCDSSDTASCAAASHKSFPPAVSAKRTTNSRVSNTTNSNSLNVMLYSLQQANNDDEDTIESGAAGGGEATSPASSKKSDSSSRLSKDKSQRLGQLTSSLQLVLDNLEDLVDLANQDSRIFDDSESEDAGPPRLVNVNPDDRQAAKASRNLMRTLSTRLNNSDHGPSTLLGQLEL